MTKAPDISVLMPVRDGKFLQGALSSILAQSLERFELIVVDDASDAGTQATLAAAAKADARVRILRRETSEGLPAALNAGLDMCRAPLIARADADDLYHPDRLARQAAEFAARPTLAALSCGWRQIDEDGRVLFTHSPTTGPDNLRFLVMFGAPLLHPGAMCRADAVRAVGGYDPAYWTAQDSDLWARMAPTMELDNLSEPLVDWRLHGSTISTRRGAPGQALSLGIAARQQRAYLDAPMTDAQVADGVAAFASAAPLPLDRLLAGERHLARLLARAQDREAPGVTRCFAGRVASALARQSRWALRGGRLRDALTLVRLAARWQVRARTARAAQGSPTARFAA